MARARVAVNAAVLAAAVRIDRLRETDVGRVVVRDDGARAFDGDEGLQFTRIGFVRRPAVVEHFPRDAFETALHERARSPKIAGSSFCMADTVYMNSTKRNVGLLAACQALLFTNNSTLIAINGLAGLSLAPYAGLATLPVTCWVLGGAIATMPASLYMKRVGRQRGLIRGTLWGVVGALICVAAIWAQSFWLLCFGTLVFGVFNAHGQYYRFVAADVAPAISGPPRFRSSSPAAWSAASSARPRAAGPSTLSRRSSWARTSCSSRSRSRPCCCFAISASRRRARASAPPAGGRCARSFRSRSTSLPWRRAPSATVS